MQIKKLELFGFKSFADRTEFVFDRGVTCIVGPNGCGKSNVVDAVKWILGEQSAKSLRGQEMLDVVFNGSANRHPLGFAEATLTFDNTSRRLPLDVAEVAVTRRLYRSGESEYLINRQSCRLKDIREMMMDTGAGLNAYSLIEQGRVEVLLQSNPQERRAVFEEAAGISKYKSKKKEALRKLERTDQNLLRLSDIVEEVERRLRSVKYQAGKARSWQTCNDRLKDLRTQHALNEYHNLSRRGDELTGELAAAQDERTGLQAQTAGLEAERSRLDTELLALEDELRSVDNQLMDVRGQIGAAEDAIAFNRTRIDEWLRTQERDRKRTADLDLRLGELEGQIAGESEAAGAIDSRLAGMKAELAETENQLLAAQQAARSTVADLERRKSEIMELLQQASQARNEISNADLRTENLAATRTRLQRRLGEIAEQLERVGKEKAETETRIGELDSRLDRDKKRLQGKHEEAEALNKEAEGVAAETAAAKEFRSGLVSRQELLADLEQRGEGLEQGVRRVLELSQSGVFTGLRGIVASLFNVDTRYAMLIEAALGEAEQSIVISRRQDVLAGLETLEEALEGRAGFLPLDSLRPAAEPLDVSQFPGVVARAADLVQTEPDLRPAVECLLGRTLLVNDLATALQLASGPLAAMRFVTMAGEVVEPDGRLSLGRVMAKAGLISRHSERRTIDTQLAEVQSRIVVLTARSEDVLRRIHGLDDEQKELRSVIYDTSTARVDLAAQLRRLDDTAAAVRAEQPLLNSEIAEADALTAQLVTRRGEFDARLTQLETESARRREEVENLGHQLSLSEAERHKIEDRRTQQRVDVATVEEQRRSVVDRLAHLRDTRDDAARQRRDAAEELARCATRLAEAERTILRHESVIADLFLKKEAAAARSRELAQARTAGREQVAGLAEQVRELAEQLHAAEEKFHALDIEARECRLKMETLCQRVRDDFGLDLVEKHASYVAQEVDWAAIDTEIEDLKGKIERLGAVNLDAIKEQDELERRAEFLKVQQNDLQQAGKMLNDLIARLNQESVTRFTATFAQVRENFVELFRKLFGGGKADIVLLNPEDVLESGIEIIARPPGKEPCSISLLSGGEKTMTAVALLMAVFRSKPSPYCILDEVDAALDEANNQRFNRLVQEFVKDSQFIIISHSKRTMSAADVLYGVTMQEPGVSKKISVRFSDVHNINLNDPAALAAQDQPEQAAGA